MTEEEERKQLGEIIIKLAAKIAGLQKRLLEVEKWADTRPADSVKKLREILERREK